MSIFHSNMVETDWKSNGKCICLLQTTRKNFEVMKWSFERFQKCFISITIAQQISYVKKKKNATYIVPSRNDNSNNPRRDRV